ncbi:MAG: hypothetical protein R2822_30850 [Spirosomataceae bacterium]
MTKSAKFFATLVAIFVSSLVYSQLYEGESAPAINNIVVGRAYVPKWENTTTYSEYFALSKEYNNKAIITWSTVVNPVKYKSVEEFKRIMTKKYPNGRWIENHCREEAL